MIRLFEMADREKLLLLFDLNSPAYFAVEEKVDFIDYLENKKEKYFVFEKDGEIIGAGGINFFPEKKTARIAWDMVHPAHHGKGIGGQLTSHRFQVIKAMGVFEKIVVRTSQHAHLFYEKMGFILKKTEKDFWAKGFDLYEMEINLK